MMTDPVVFLVSREAMPRRMLAARLKAAGLSTVLCRSAEEFFENYEPGKAGCVLLEVVRLPADLELLSRLGSRESHLPVVVISAVGGIETAVAAMKLGAMDFVETSCSDARLAEAIEECFLWDAAHRRKIAQAETARRRLARLEPRHREVLDLLIAGRSNGEIAEELGLSVRAIEERRAKVVKLMRARSLAELIRLSLIGGHDPDSPTVAEKIDPGQPGLSDRPASAGERTAGSSRPRR